MKTLLNIVILLIIVPQSFCQPILFERILSESYMSSLNRITYIDSGKWVVAGNLGNGCIMPALASVSGQNGTCIFIPDSVYSYRDTVNYGTFNDVIHSGSDSSIIAVGFGMPADDVGPDNGYLIKTDYSGDIILSKKYNFIGNFDLIRKFKNDYLVTTSSHNQNVQCILKINNAGDTLWLHHYCFGQINDLAEINDSVFAVSSNVGVIIINSDGIVYDTLFYGDSIIQIEAGNNIVAFIKENRLYSAVSSFDIIDSVSLSAYSQVIKLAFYNNSYFILGKNLTGKALITQYDPLLTPVRSLVFDNEYARPTDFFVEDSVIAVVGQTHQDNQSFIKTFDLAGNTYTHSIDIGVTNLIVDSVNYTHPAYYPLGLFDVRYYTTVSIANNGDDTVSSFHIGATYPDMAGINCFTNYIYSSYNQSVLPHGDIAVPLTFNISYRPFNPESYQQPLCVWTYDPNMKIDNNQSNDKFCDTLVNIHEVTYYKKIIIYPNPSDEKFTFEFDNPSRKVFTISITDITGKTIYETETTQEKYEYDGKELQEGVYLVKVMEDKVYFGKIVVTH